jgi:hypothetical protein
MFFNSFMVKITYHEGHEVIEVATIHLGFASVAATRPL